MFDPTNVAALEMVQPSYNFMMAPPPQSAQTEEEKESENAVEVSQATTQQPAETEPDTPSMWREPVEEPRVSTTEAAYDEGGNAINGGNGVEDNEDNVDQLSGGAAAEGTVPQDSAASAGVPETGNPQAAETAISPVPGNSLDLYG